jgi:hypothetical protein
MRILYTEHTHPKKEIGKSLVLNSNPLDCGCGGVDKEFSKRLNLTIYYNFTNKNVFEW